MTDTPIFTFDPILADVATRLADEEVPLRVIARALRKPAEEVRDVLHDAVANGRIIRIPRDDWHPNPRGQLVPVVQEKKWEDEELIFNCVRTFKVTRLQASMLSLLMRRNEVSKEMMHHQIEQRRRNSKAEETDPKMVDVVVCHLRKRLKPFNLEIKTLWSCGYYMVPEHRARAHELLLQNLQVVPYEKAPA